ncbi:MAG: hypothetical protein ACPH3N_02330 [Alcanivorax sediminis]|uniref:hypothetical protein n=1 Tax=Alcanivorax sediminis TaxID=2663008 RepID=UPI003C3E0DAC
MNKRVNIAYHEVDFLLPAHRFDIRFSYVTKKGLPFVREFVLRLVHISPMKPVDIATYFGLSRREVDEAITDLVEKGDLEFSEKGQIELTPKSRGYFVSLGSTPLVSSLMESGGVFAFELASFNCVGRKLTCEKRAPGLWLDVPNETVASSERIAKKKFQEKFHKIQEQGFWEHKSYEGDSGRPSIYIMESVQKLGQEPLRLTSYLSIDPEGVPVERDDFEDLDDSSVVQELVTDALASARKPVNFKQVAQAMVTLEDQETRTLFNDHSVDIAKLLAAQQSGKINDGEWIPFLGPLYSKANWKLISEYFEMQLAEIKKAKGEPSDLLWIAPSDGFWGQSLRTSTCLSELIDLSITKGKKPTKHCNPKLYLPVQDATDRRAIGRWKQAFSGHKKEVYGLVEGFLDGNVEILLIPSYMAVVCYHISRPDTLPVSLPVGYITTDKSKVRVVSSAVKEYVEGVVSFDNPRDLGAIEKI